MAGARKPPRSSRRRWIAIVILVAAAAAAYYFWQERSARRDAVSYRTAQVVRGPISASVSASGTLNPVVAVPVSSQVSGQVREVLVDFNASVRKGQLIARIDPETFEYRVRQSQADLEASRAQVLTAQANASAARAAVSRAGFNVAEAERDLGRKQSLVERGFISPAEVDRALALVNSTTEDQKAARAQLDVTLAQARSAEAVVRQREAQLAQARVDLERTAIRAPVDGIVIKRSVEPGQTVAASLQAPELFIIARSLVDMQVETSVDEAEIGRIKAGQRATFTVDSFPGRSFSGEVLQVRKAAQTVQNVVTYTVIVSAANQDQALVPGMTANVRIVTEQRDDVLKVPNAALRFKPPDFQEPQPGRAAAHGARDAIAAALSALLAPAHAQASGQPGGALAQFRARLDRELGLSDAQKQQVDAIFASMREKFAAAREAPEAERAASLERARTELRTRIAGQLDGEQKKKYAEIVAEITARSATAAGGAGTSAASGAPATVPAAPAAASGSQTAGGKADAAPPAARVPAGAPDSKAAGPVAKPSTPAASGAPAGGPGGALRQLRERLERELALTEMQRQQVDAIFAGMREKFMAVRDAPEAERARLSERNRAELRERISEILTPEQRTRYQDIVAQSAGRQSARGRIFVLDAAGKPQPLQVRTGLTDGSFTEVSAEGLKEGDTVVIGVAAASTAQRPAQPSTPRLPF